MVAVLDPMKYSQLVQPLIVCLDHSMLKKALVSVEDVPISQLLSAYSITSYNKQMDVMNFELQGVKMSISMFNFYKLLVLSTAEDLIALDKISASTIIQACHQMGYNSNLSVLSQFKKSALPPIWSALFTIMFKCFFEQSTGSDNASRLFHNLYMEFIRGTRFILEQYCGINSFKVFIQRQRILKFHVIDFGPLL